MEKPELQRPPTLAEWRVATGEHARKVADMIDAVMSGRASPDPIYSLRTLKEKLSQLGTFNLRPQDDAEFGKKIDLLEAQKPGQLNTDEIREVADFLSPPSKVE